MGNKSAQERINRLKERADLNRDGQINADDIKTEKGKKIAGIVAIIVVVALILYFTKG